MSSRRAELAFSFFSLAPQQSTVVCRLKTLRVSGLEMCRQLLNRLDTSCTHCHCWHGLHGGCGACPVPVDCQSVGHTLSSINGFNK